MRCLRKVAAVLLAVAAGTAPTASVDAQQPTGVVFENVRIFDRSSDRLTEPSNVRIVGNIIKGGVPDHDRGTCGGDSFLPRINPSRR